MGSVGSNLLGIGWIQSSWVGPNLLGIGFSQSSGDQLYPIFLGLGTPSHSWEQPVPNTTHIFDFVQHVRVELHCSILINYFTVYTYMTNKNHFYRRLIGLFNIALNVCRESVRPGHYAFSLTGNVFCIFRIVGKSGKCVLHFLYRREIRENFTSCTSVGAEPYPRH